MALAAPGGVGAVALFQVDTFENGTLEGWGGGASPTNIPTGGPDGAGDAYLQITSTGTGGPGSKPAAVNGGGPPSPWSGDYSGLGVRAITLDMRNDVTSEPLEMRLALFASLESSRWTSSTAEMVPNDGNWHSYRFYISESELTQVLGTISYNQLLSDIGQIMVRHDPDTPSPGGETAFAILGLDNIRLVPNINCQVFDNLVATIVAGTNDPAWDINEDTFVNSADLDELRALGGLINLASRNPYKVGDANLDGVVDGSDFIAWNANKFTSNPSWCKGDFNADGVVDGSDFILWNGNKFTSSDGVAVPEPAGQSVWVMMLAALLAGALLRLRGDRRVRATCAAQGDHRETSTAGYQPRGASPRFF
jgi:hypothetical protein